MALRLEVRFTKELEAVELEEAKGQLVPIKLLRERKLTSRRWKPVLRAIDLTTVLFPDPRAPLTSTVRWRS